ncbi:MAG: hypothetical protein IJK46_04415 [Prevotella sp.]|nr:hypothetical protein [Prevotella sp.]
MRRCFLLINLLTLLCLLPCHAQDVADDSIVSSEYTFLMQARGQELTGICMVSIAPDGNLTGTIVNEFGIKAFDFLINRGKVRLVNVMKPLDKWYIKKVLRKDFGFAFRHIPQGKDTTEKKQRITFPDNGEIIVDNDKYKIHYVFTPIAVSDETDQ